MNRRFLNFTIAFLCTICLLCGCSSAPAVKEQNSSFFAMDTYITFRAYGDSEEPLTRAEQLILDLESELSVTREDSLIGRLNRDGQAELSQDAAELLSEALELCRETNGALDITLYPLLREWGFTTGTYQVPAQETIDSLLQSVDYRNVSLSGDTVSIPDGASVDLGSVAKGYAGMKAADFLRESGITSAVLNLGGNVQTIGTKPDGSPWRIAIKSPQGDGYLGVLETSDEAVVTSGGYERYFEDDNGNIWWHILDPATGYPADSGILSATAVGKDGLRCDALSTSLFVMGAEKAAEFWKEHGDFDMILVTADGRLLLTPGVSGRFTPDESSQYEWQVIGDAEN